jgi:hypothetical protein
MFVAAGLGFVDLVEDNVFAPNDLNQAHGSSAPRHYMGRFTCELHLALDKTYSGTD